MLYEIYNNISKFNNFNKKLLEKNSEFLDSIFQTGFNQNSISLLNNDLTKTFQSNLFLYKRLIKEYKKLPWDINTVVVNETIYNVSEEVVQKTYFCELKKFSIPKKDCKNFPILLIAPMSGHYATLLRETVRELVKYHDVYITDWLNPRDINLDKGVFGMEEYIDTIVLFSEKMPKNYSTVCVCQPTVTGFVANAYMSNKNNRKQSNLPKNIILMGGPMMLDDNENKVTLLGKEKSIDWFRQNVIYTVPNDYIGAGREVYPGFLQLFSFMSMNWSSHFNKHVDISKKYFSEDFEDLEKITDFYDEYFAVMDLDAKFYLDTIDYVFKRRLLARKQFPYKGQYYGLRDLDKKVNILTVEGEKDDISPVGQTSDIIPYLSNKNKERLIVKNVGHYGLFSGKKWRDYTSIQITDFIKKNN
jgi:poly(3-hydroxybutyrate) depolymerase